MAHPSGASHKHSPAWLDRMKRAEGGSVEPIEEKRARTMDATFGSLVPPGAKHSYEKPASPNKGD